MAKHNEVRLYGQVANEPKIFKNDETGELVRGIASLIVIRGIRNFGNKMDNIKYDAPAVMSGNPEIIAEMEKWKQGDMIEIKGAITTKDVLKTKTCPHCGKKNKRKGTAVFINPVFVAQRETGVADEKERLAILRKNSEISNSITIMGVVCRDKQVYETKRGLAITTYQLASQRKYRIKEDAEDTRTDFPWVKAYGQIAKSDAQAIRKGSLVFVDGMIQTRDVARDQTCEFCGEPFAWPDTAMEIVPYATEYLRNYYTPEEIEQRNKEESSNAIKKIFNEKEIDAPEGAPEPKDLTGEEFKRLL